MKERTSKDIPNEGPLFNIFGSQPGKVSHGLIEKKIFPPEGGILVKLVGCSYLFKGYPSGIVMGQLEVSKDALWFLVGILENNFVKLMIIATFLLSRKRFWKIFSKIMREYLIIAHQPLKRKGFIPKDGKDYCKSVKELYRASKVILGEDEEVSIKRDTFLELSNKEQRRVIFMKLRDIVLMVLQFDTAYKFIVQDILPEFNIENIKKNAGKEVDRIIGILIKRELSGAVKSKWQRVRKKVAIAMKIPFIKKTVSKILSEINYEEVKLDEDDWYFVLRNPHYDFRDVSFVDRLAEAKKIDKEKGHNIPYLVWIQKPHQHFEINNN